MPLAQDELSHRCLAVIAPHGPDLNGCSNLLLSCPLLSAPTFSGKRQCPSSDCVSRDGAITPEVRRGVNWTMVLAIPWYRAATHFPGRKAEHYVLPAERYGAAGDRFSAKAYDIDPSKPIGGIKEAWEAATMRTTKILKGETEAADSGERILPLACHFHNLRHTAVSRMLNPGTPIAKVTKIVGWSASTMVLTTKCYGHFSLTDLRGAVESIGGAGIEAVSPVNSPVSENPTRKHRPD